MTVANQNYKLIQNIKTFPVISGKFHLEINVMSWYDKEPVYDIRKWSDDHEKMSKGITLTEAEYKALFEEE